MEGGLIIAVEAAGAITPVGANLTDSMIGLYTRVQLFDDLNVLDEEGEPLSGMKIPLADGPDGPDRLLAMTNAVVDEAPLALDATTRIPLKRCPEIGQPFSSRAKGSAAGGVKRSRRGPLWTRLERR